MDSLAFWFDQNRAYESQIGWRCRGEDYFPALYFLFSAIAFLIFSPSSESGLRISSTTDSEEKFSTRADDLRVSTASGSERGFRKGLIDGAPLATARGTDSEAQVEKLGDELHIGSSPNRVFHARV